MIISLDRNELIDKLKVFSSVIDRKDKLESLRFLKVKEIKGVLYVIGSNGTLKLISNIKNYEFKEFKNRKEFLLEPFKTLEFAQKVNGEKIEIDVDEKKEIVIVKCKKSKITLPSYDSKSFPNLNFPNGDFSFKINCSDLIDILNKVKNSVSYATNRPILNGINIKCENKKIYFQSSDSYRVSKTSYYCDYIDEKENFDVVIPISTIKFMMKIIDRNKDDFIKFDVAKDSIIMRYKEYCFGTKIIEGVFPNVDRAFPKSYEMELKFHGQILIEILKRCSIIKNEDSISNITINIDLENNSIKVNSYVSQVGKIEDEFNDFEIISSNSKNIEISFNSEYLQNSLSCIDTDYVLMKIGGSLKPCLIQDSQEKDIQLILPVKTI